MATETKEKIFGMEIGIKVDRRLTKWIGIAFGVIIVIVVVAWLVLIPRLSEIRRLQAKLKEQKLLLTNLNQKIDLIDDFGISLSGKDDLMNQVFMSNQDSTLLLMLLRNVVNQTGMNITSYKIGSSVLKTMAVTQKSTKPINTNVVVDVTVSGPSDKVDSLLRIFNESLPIKSVSDFEITDGSLQSTGQITMKMTVTAYTLPVNVNASALALLKPFTDEQRDLMQRMTGYYQVPPIEKQTAQPVGGSNRLLGF